MTRHFARTLAVAILAVVAAVVSTRCERSAPVSSRAAPSNAEVSAWTAPPGAEPSGPSANAEMDAAPLPSSAAMDTVMVEPQREKWGFAVELALPELAPRNVYYERDLKGPWAWEPTPDTRVKLALSHAHRYCDNDWGILQVVCWPDGTGVGRTRELARAGDWFGTLSPTGAVLAFPANEGIAIEETVSGKRIACVPWPQDARETLRVGRVEWLGERYLWVTAKGHDPYGSHCYLVDLRQQGAVLYHVADVSASCVSSDARIALVTGTRDQVQGSEGAFHQELCVLRVAEGTVTRSTIWAATVRAGNGEAADVTWAGNRVIVAMHAVSQPTDMERAAVTRVLCLDAMTGRELWQETYKNLVEPVRIDLGRGLSLWDIRSGYSQHNPALWCVDVNGSAPKVVGSSPSNGSVLGGAYFGTARVGGGY